jgi:hypothetical protein
VNEDYGLPGAVVLIVDVDGAGVLVADGDVGHGLLLVVGCGVARSMSRPN